MEIRWSVPAAEDLERICAWIERENPAAAERRTGLKAHGFKLRGSSAGGGAAVSTGAAIDFVAETEIANQTK